MKYKYKYIHVVKSEHRPIYCVLTNKDDGIIGIIEWYFRWRQWIFMPHANAVFSVDCLADIADAIQQIATDHVRGKGNHVATPFGTDA